MSNQFLQELDCLDMLHEAEVFASQVLGEILLGTPPFKQMAKFSHFRNKLDNYIIVTVFISTKLHSSQKILHTYFCFRN